MSAIPGITLIFQTSDGTRVPNVAYKILQGMNELATGITNENGIAATGLVLDTPAFLPATIEGFTETQGLFYNPVVQIDTLGQTSEVLIITGNFVQSAYYAIIVNVDVFRLIDLALTNIFGAPLATVIKASVGSKTIATIVAKWLLDQTDSQLLGSGVRIVGSAVDISTQEVFIYVEQRKSSPVIGLTTIVSIILLVLIGITVISLVWRQIGLNAAQVEREKTLQTAFEAQAEITLTCLELVAQGKATLSDCQKLQDSIVAAQNQIIDAMPPLTGGDQWTSLLIPIAGMIMLGVIGAVAVRTVLEPRRDKD